MGPIQKRQGHEPPVSKRSNGLTRALRPLRRSRRHRSLASGWGALGYKSRGQWPGPRTALPIPDGLSYSTRLLQAPNGHKHGAGPVSHGKRALRAKLPAQTTLPQLPARTQAKTVHEAQGMAEQGLVSRVCRTPKAPPPVPQTHSDQGAGGSQTRPPLAPQLEHPEWSTHTVCTPAAPRGRAHGQSVPAARAAPEREAPEGASGRSMHSARQLSGGRARSQLGPHRRPRAGSEPGPACSGTKPALPGPALSPQGSRLPPAASQPDPEKGYLQPKRKFQTCQPRGILSLPPVPRDAAAAPSPQAYRLICGRPGAAPVGVPEKRNHDGRRLGKGSQEPRPAGHRGHLTS